MLVCSCCSPKTDPNKDSQGSAGDAGAGFISAQFVIATSVRVGARPALPKASCLLCRLKQWNMMGSSAAIQSAMGTRASLDFVPGFDAVVFRPPRASQPASNHLREATIAARCRPVLPNGRKNYEKTCPMNQLGHVKLKTSLFRQEKTPTSTSQVSSTRRFDPPGLAGLHRERRVGVQGFSGHLKRKKKEKTLSGELMLSALNTQKLKG